jgi:hypothetical protein
VFNPSLAVERLFSEQESAPNAACKALIPALDRYIDKVRSRLVVVGFPPDCSSVVTRSSPARQHYYACPCPSEFRTRLVP